MKNNIIFFIICLVLLQLTHTTFGRKKACPPNSTWTDCGSTCPSKCSDGPDDDICTDDCVETCECNKGYVLDKKNNCIKKADCPRKKSRGCRRGMYYSSCPNHVENKCGNSKKPPIVNTKKQRCGKPKCICPINYVLMRGKCVKNPLCFMRKPSRPFEKKSKAVII